MAINNKKDSELCVADSVKIVQMAIKDTSFVDYLRRHINTKMLFTIQDKCKKYVGTKLIDTKFKTLNQQRLTEFKSFFVAQAVEKQLVMRSDKNTVPYNGFSFYELSYDRGFPKELVNAYRKIDELNEASPRKKFRRLRRKNLFGF